MIQLFHSVLSRVLWASSQFILCPSCDVDATAEDQNVSGACRGEVGWVDLASAMAVQLLLRALALVVIQSLPSPQVEAISSTCPLCTRRGGYGNAGFPVQSALYKRLFSCRTAFNVVVAGVRV